MATPHGKHTRILVDEFNLSTYFNELTTTREQELAEATGFGANGKTWLLGQQDGSLSASGFWDPAAGGSDVVLAAALGASSAKVVTISREAFDAVGDGAELLSAHETTYETSSTTEDAVATSAEFQATDGGVNRGVVLHAMEAETTDNNEASVDNLAASANGGVAHLHATAFSGFTGVVIKVQHSTDNFSASIVDLVTFANLTAAGKERVVVAAGTTVHRYLRASTDVSGAGSITYAVAFARR